MNRLKEYIYTNGKWIGEGSTRVAFRFGDRVFKIPFRENGKQQSEIEKMVFEEYGDSFNCFFPKPFFHSNGIIEMDYIQTVDEFVGSWSDEPLQDIISHNLSTPENVDEFIKFCNILHESGLLVDDLLTNGGNIGISNNQIVLIDWGYTNKMYKTCTLDSSIAYHTMKKLIRA